MALAAGSCASAIANASTIASQMRVPLIQGALREAYEVRRRPCGGEDRSPTKKRKPRFVGGARARVCAVRPGAVSSRGLRHEKEGIVKTRPPTELLRVAATVVAR